MRSSGLSRKQESINAYTKALEIQPGLAEGWVKKGHAFADLGKIPDAISAYTRALDINPSLHDIWMRKGDALNQIGKIR